MRSDADFVEKNGHTSWYPGFSTLVLNGTGHEHRYTQIMKIVHRSKLHVMGLQEPHIPDEQTVLNLHEQFSKRDIKLLTNLSPKGRGGGSDPIPHHMDARPQLDLDQPVPIRQASGPRRHRTLLRCLSFPS